MVIRSIPSPIEKFRERHRVASFLKTETVDGNSLLHKGVFLDNMPFYYAEGSGRFISNSKLVKGALTIEEIRQCGMHMSYYEVWTVDGVPYFASEHHDVLYRVGNSASTMDGETFERHCVRGTPIETPHGNAFRKIVEAERLYWRKQRERER